MWKESLQHPYTSKLLSIDLIENDQYHLIAKTVLEFMTKNHEGKNKEERSVVECYFMLLKDDPMLYLTYRLDFHGQKVLLKLDIPTATNAERAEVDVALGNESRSTRPKTARDLARWENNMHNWINLPSEDKSWGFAVLNNGKYGVDYHNGYLGISLIHGQPYFPPRVIAWVFEERMKRIDKGLGQPPGWIDHGSHIISLALYPHEGTYIDAKVVEKANLFNQPPLNIVGNSFSTDLMSILKYTHFPTVSSPLNVITLKPPHLDSDSVGWDIHNWESTQNSVQRVLILRILNPARDELQGTVKFRDLPVIAVKNADLLEREIAGSDQISVQKDATGRIIAVTDHWHPCEIKTFGLLIKI
jgi:alpha-mannosidase